MVSKSSKLLYFKNKNSKINEWKNEETRLFISLYDKWKENLGQHYFIIIFCFKNNYLRAATLLSHKNLILMNQFIIILL
jgi:hypothetical protein